MSDACFFKNILLQKASETDAIEAFSLYDGENIQRISGKMFVGECLKAAGYFYTRRIQNKHVAIIAQSNYNWLVTFFAIVASNNIPVLMNPDLPADTLEWQLTKADVSLICCDQTFCADNKLPLAGLESVCFEDLQLEKPISLDMISSKDGRDTIAMLYTSGTTGASKVVEVTAEGFACAVENFGEQYGADDITRIMTPLPFYHVVGLLHHVSALVYNKTSCIGRGIKYVFLDMGALNPHMLNVVPMVLESFAKMLRNPRMNQSIQKYIGTNLKVISFAGAALKEPVLRCLLDQGFIMMVNYGMTEIPVATLAVIECEKHFRSAGKFTKNLQCRFDNGELVMKGPTMMKGYYRDTAEMQKVVEDGWIHTGDLGFCDEDGHFYLTGRKKNVIILSNGENVNPEEIERKLGYCDAILECIVYSDGNGICADIYADNRDTVTNYIKEYNKSMPLYGQVYKVNFSENPLPKTGSGKLKRKENK